MERLTRGVGDDAYRCGISSSSSSSSSGTAMGAIVGCWRGEGLTDPTSSRGVMSISSNSPIHAPISPSGRMCDAGTKADTWCGACSCTTVTAACGVASTVGGVGPAGLTSMATWAGATPPSCPAVHFHDNCTRFCTSRHYVPVVADGDAVCCFVVDAALLMDGKMVCASSASRASSSGSCCVRNMSIISGCCTGGSTRCTGGRGGAGVDGSGGLPGSVILARYDISFIKPVIQRTCHGSLRGRAGQRRAT